MYDDIKYCAGGCGVILWELSMLPHRKYCDDCNIRLSYERSKLSQKKYREKYRQKSRERYHLKKLGITS
jgi:hypothetical protein